MSTLLFPDQSEDPSSRVHPTAMNFEMSDTLLLGPMPDFQDFTMSDSAINLACDMLAGCDVRSTTVSTPSAGFHNPAAHSTPLNQEQPIYYQAENMMDFEIKAPNRKANMSAIDLSFLCHDLGIKEGSNARHPTKEPGTSDRSRVSQTQKSHDESLRAAKSQVEHNRKKGQYWYSKYKAAESSREQLEKRVKRHEAEAEKSEFQAISKAMKEWELEFRRSRELMRRANHSIEKSFRILKESVLGTHMQDREPDKRESRNADIVGYSENNELNRPTGLAHAFTSLHASRCPRGPAIREQEAHRRKSSSNLMLKDTSVPRKSVTDPGDRSESSLTVESRQSSSPAIRHAKDQAALSKKYMNVVKDKRDSASKDRCNSGNLVTKIRKLSSRSRTGESSPEIQNGNKKQKRENKGPTGGH